eukprot:scaffold13564_cov128-Alexandrium_tamarense.AAC.18
MSTLTILSALSIFSPHRSGTNNVVGVALAFSPSSTSPLFRPVGSMQGGSNTAANGVGNAARAGMVGDSIDGGSSCRKWKRRLPQMLSRFGSKLFMLDDNQRDTTDPSGASTRTKEVNGSEIKSRTSSTEDQATLQKLLRENTLLQSRLKLLQKQNDELIQLQRKSQQLQSSSQGEKDEFVGRKMREQRLILEDFEGEGIPMLDARGGIVDGWNKQKKRYTEPWDLDTDIEFEKQVGGGEDDYDELGLSPSAALSGEYEEADDDALCEYDSQTNKWTSSSDKALGIGECPVEPNLSFTDALKSRAYWLVGLLALQSCSGFILSRNEALLQDHPVIVYFLTMLVGAGGNAGNQASVRGE